MVRLRTADPLRHLPLEGLGGWLLVALLTADAFVVTKGLRLHFPNHIGVHYWVVWLVSVPAALLVASLLAARFRPAVPRLRPVEASARLGGIVIVMSGSTMAVQPRRYLGLY